MVTVPVTTNNNVRDEDFAPVLELVVFPAMCFMLHFGSCSGWYSCLLFRAGQFAQAPLALFPLICVALTLLFVHSCSLTHPSAQHQLGSLLPAVELPWVSNVCALADANALQWLYHKLNFCSAKYPSSTSLHPWSNNMNSIWGSYSAFNFPLISEAGLFAVFLNREAQIHPLTNIRIIWCLSLLICE